VKVRRDLLIFALRAAHARLRFRDPQPSLGSREMRSGAAAPGAAEG